MRRTALFLALSFAAAAPALAGPPWIRATLPSDYLDARARGAFLIIHTFHHSDPMPLASLAGTAFGLVNGRRTSVPLTFVADTLQQGAGQYLIPKSWSDGGVWVLNIEGRLDMGAGLVVGIGRDGAPLLVQMPRGRYGVSRPATPREVDQLLQYLDGQRASAPAMSDPQWMNLLTPPGLLLLAMILGASGLVALGIRTVRTRRMSTATA